MIEADRHRAGVVGARVVEGLVIVALCHLQRGSVRVRAGDEVRAGDLIGACGNSGNSTEPHMHMQGRPNPGNASGASGRRSERSVNGAVRSPSPRGTKSIAYAEAKRCVPWLGTRSAGLFCTSQRPVKG